MPWKAQLQSSSPILEKGCILKNPIKNRLSYDFQFFWPLLTYLPRSSTKRLIANFVQDAVAQWDYEQLNFQSLREIESRCEHKNLFKRMVII